jgi:hypothetical protein
MASMGFAATPKPHGAMTGIRQLSCSLFATRGPQAQRADPEIEVRPDTRGLAGGLTVRAPVMGAGRSIRAKVNPVVRVGEFG